VSGIVTNSGANAAVYGQSTAGSANGVGVEGYGSTTGVYGYSKGLYGTGVVGFADGANGIGVQGIGGSDGYGVYASVSGGTQSYSAAVYAEDDSESGAYSYAVYGISENNIAVYGTSNNVSARFQGGRSGTGTCSYLGGSGWECSSDKNLKKDLVPVDSDALLEHLAELPMFEYSMKGDSTSARYVGPTAQDFMAAFHLGSDDKLINTANAQGVALAAAKQLYEKVKQDEAEIAELKKLLASQAAHVADVEAAFTARMATLEQRRNEELQAVAFKR
jgi:hypothetical protein